MNEQQVVETEAVALASNLDLLLRAEIDTQIATAKAFPRQVDRFARTMKGWICNEDVAEACIFALPKGGKNIEGASIRFAELAVAAWGNCRVSARVVHVGDSTVSAQGTFHDLETNAATSDETQRSIRTSKGGRYGQDMIVTTGRAACAIARRNAALAGIPRTLWEPLYIEARRIVAGQQQTMANKRASALEYLQKIGVSAEMVLATLELKTVEDMTDEHIVSLRAAARQIRDLETTIEAAFVTPRKPVDAEPVADGQQTTLGGLAAAAAATFDKATAPPHSPAPIRTETASEGPGKAQVTKPAPDTRKG